GPQREQLRKARKLIDAALTINPNLPRARFYNALLLRSEGKAKAAADEFSKLAHEYPRDREVQRQLGQTAYALGHIAEAHVAFETVLMIDPNDAGAYQFLAPIYASQGRSSEAERSRSLYLLWRDDPLTDVIANRFFAANPNWADERIMVHAHGNGSSARPTLTGELAAPQQ